MQPRPPLLGPQPGLLPIRILVRSLARNLARSWSVHLRCGGDFQFDSREILLQLGLFLQELLAPS